MVKLKGSDSQEFELIPENDIVNVRLQDVELRTFQWDNETVEKLKWVFVVVDPGPWEGKEIFGDTSTTFTAHPNCKAFNWVAAITGRQYGAGEELDTDELLGMPCRVMIAHKTDKQGRTWMRVREVIAARGGSLDTATAPLVPEETPF